MSQFQRKTPREDHMDKFHAELGNMENSRGELEDLENSHGIVIPVEPSYNKLSENFRKVTPQEVLCSMFCGGRKCKYENWQNWKMNDMAIDGIYSHWITTDILAMARPNTKIINDKNIIGQFLQNGIKTLVNLQMPGEHSKCGRYPLEPSGFSYQPEDFMENGIYFYNFGWKDYGESTLQGLLNVVKVVAFAVSEGKVAIHCHAGLGRTGVLISCYLVYALRVRAYDAIRYVRKKRAHAVQTRSQIMCVQEFELFLMPYFRVFSLRDYVKDVEKKDHPDFTLASHLAAQNVILHGFEARSLRHIPKIIYVICERLLRLCQAGEKSSNGINFRLTSKNLPFTRTFMSSQFDSDQTRRLPYVNKWRSESTDSVVSSASSVTSKRGGTNFSLGAFSEQSLSLWKSPTPSEISHAGTLEDLLDDALGDSEISSADFQDLSSSSTLYKAINCDTVQIPAVQVADALLAAPEIYYEVVDLVRLYKLDLNGRLSVWCKLASETNTYALSALLWDWLLHLKSPILTYEELSFIVVYSNDPKFCLSKFDEAARYTVEYLLYFLSRLLKLFPGDQAKIYEERLLKRLIAVLTQQGVVTEGLLFPPQSRKLGNGTLEYTTEFLRNFLNCIESSASNKSEK